MSAEPVVLVIDGPNLNLLGDREPEIYGTTTLDEIVDDLRTGAAKAGLVIEHVQSNHEGELVDAVQGARKRCAAIIINGGAFTHYSWALHDALAAYEGYVIEVHISNPQARESWRHTSVITPVADGAIIGVGALGYQLALQAIAGLLHAVEAE